MRCDKVATRILLILSAVRVAAAAPAIIRQRSLEVTKNMTPALEKRANLDDESSHHFPRVDNNVPSTSSGTLPSQDDTSPAPGGPQLHSDSPPELGTPQLHMDHPPMSGTPQVQDDLAPAPGGPMSQEDPLLAYKTPQLHNDHPSTSGAPPSQDDTVPGSGTPQSQDETSPESGPPQLHIDQPPAPGGPPWQEDPLPAHGTPQLHNDQPSTPGAPPSPDDTLPGPGTLQSQDETSPASGDPQLHSGLRLPPQFTQLRVDVPSTSGTPQLQDDLPLMPEAQLSVGGMSQSSATRTLQYHGDDQPPTRGALFSEDDPWRAFIQAGLREESSYEGSPVYSGSSTTSRGPQLQNDPPRSGIPQPHEFSSWYQRVADLLFPQGLHLPQNDPPPASGTTQLHDDGSEEFDSWYRMQALPISPDFDSETPLHLEAPLPLDLESDAPPSAPGMQALPISPDFHSDTPLHLEAPLPLDLESDAPPSAPETHTLFNDAIMQKLKPYGVVGAVAGVTVGLAFGVKKLIDDHSHGSHPAGRDLASSGVVGRGASMHPRPPKNPRNEDLRLLSILTRRALERLD